MKSKKNNSGLFAVFHPFLFGIYPVLTLYLLNINEIVFSGIWQAVITSCVVTLVIVVVSLVIFRAWERAAAFASLTISMFFLYGHVFEITNGLTLFGVDLARHRYFIPFWVVIYLSGLLFLLRRKDISSLTRVLNTISLFLIVSTLAQIVFYAFQIGFLHRSVNANTVNESVASTPAASPADRDVYYILVDAYGRQDLLADSYNLDTTEFINGLKEAGFYLPMCSQSNYDYTTTSMSTTLNMEYLDALGLDYWDNGEFFQSFIRDSAVRAKFVKMGYSTVTFKSLYPSLDREDSTFFIDYFGKSTGMTSLASLNFQYLFLRTTAVRPLIEWLESKPEVKLSPFWSTWLPVNNTLHGRDYLQYLQNKFALDSLETIPSLPGKKFVYAHLYVTHQPFVFYPDGEFHPSLKQDYGAYNDQVIYADKRLLEIVKTILAESATEPIIIIQGDHSYSKGRDRVKMLNAYYFPDGGDKNLYRTITPVNTFRVLFNTYFHENYELLPDISRYGDHTTKQLNIAPPTCIDGSTP
jgi:hypothetical protein